MKAIIKRELSAYFNSAIGYVFLAIFFLFSGLFFFATSLNSNSTDLGYVFSSLLMLVVFLIPILTMRLISEEKKQKTDQALLTAPISLISIALGKYLSALIVYTISISVTLLYAVVLSFFNAPDWTSIIGHFIGLFLLGASLIAINLFISSVTESQVIAAVCGFAVGLLVLFMDAIKSLISIDLVGTIIKNISFVQHYNNFTMGILNIADLVFFLSVCALFIFLTVRVFEKRRWS